MYTVKEVSKILNLTEHTVRYYTNKGLIPTLKRNSNNVRLFDDASINWIIFVKHLKDCGMSICEIKEFVDLWTQGNSTIPTRYEIISEQKEKTKQELIDVKHRLDILEKKLQHYDELMNKLGNNEVIKEPKTPLTKKNSSFV